MASAIRRLCNPLALRTKNSLLPPQPSFLATQKAPFARASVDEGVKKKKKKKEEKKKKKGGPDPSAASDKDRVRFDDLVVKALEAPSPVRYVKEKERLREQEMEKYGLMTKARQIELEQEKAKEKSLKKTKRKASSSEKEDGAGEQVEGEEENGIAGQEKETAPLTKEEGMRLAKAYSRLLMREDRKFQAGATIRLRLKREAIAALPLGLQEAARVPDMAPFPGLSPATLTPPIPGFVYEYDRRGDKRASE
jgi:type IV secretory pathway VirB10-like protein